MKKNYVFLSLFVPLLFMAALSFGTPMSGVYTINGGSPTSGTNYQTFAAFVSDLSTNGISGPVTVNVTNMTYNEQISIPQITGMSANNRVVINGNGALLTYNSTSSSTPYTLWLNGTDYLVINNLQIQGTGTSYAMVCVLTGGANNNMFSACTFSAPTNATSSYQCPWAISSSSQYPSTGGSGDFNTVQSCTIAGGYYGIFHGGLTSAPYTTNNQFLDCYVTDWYYYSVYNYYSKNMTVRHCTFDRMARTTLPYYDYFSYSYACQGYTFDKNLLKDFWNTNQSFNSYYYGMAYIGCYSPDPNNRNTISNNIIRDLKWNGYTYLFYYNYSANNDYVNNTISFDNPVSTSSSCYIWYYCYNSGSYSSTWKNNLISITQAGSGSKYVYYFGGNTTGSTINNNAYYLTSTNSYMGYWTSLATTVAQWQAMNAEVTAFTVNPTFANPTTGDLHPTNTALNNLGLVIPGNTFDQMLAIRNPTAPDVGALEFLTPMCTGTPSMTVSGPTYSLCSGETANFSIGNLSSDLGYTYQWQWSNLSTVGPFTVIPNANSITTSVPNVTQTIWVSAIISCTAPGGTSIAPVATVNIAGPTTSVVPYYENFEGIGLNNRLPNCSWYAPNIGGSAKTYTSAGPNNLLPNSGSGFATFNNSSSGNNYYYTNGIYLNAGVTYSASLWYMTDFSGSTNWSKLQIVTGTAQASAAMTQTIASVAPAVSPMYKALSNTFQVTTSGMYYIGVMANVSGSSGAPNLSWDDLRIDIPCTSQYNTPAVTVSANNQTICSGQSVVLTAAGANTYSWSTGATGGATTEYPTANSTFGVVGTNTLSGCSANASIFVMVKPSPAISLFALPPVICKGSSANLQASGAASYTWNVNAQGSNINVNPSVNTSYQVMGTGTNQCVSSAAITVSVNPLPNVTASPSEQQVCYGAPLMLNGSGAVTYQWISASPAQVLIGNGLTTTINNPVVTFTMIGTDANGCSNSAVFSISADPCTGIVNHGSLDGVKVFPNPTNGLFTVALPAGSVAKLTVTDITGRVLVSDNGSDRMQMNLTSFAAGVYYMKIEMNGDTSVVKVIKD